MEGKGLEKLVKEALGPSTWDFGNKVLYDLCESYPSHENDNQIIGKIWL